MKRTLSTFASVAAATVAVLTAHAGVTATVGVGTATFALLGTSACGGCHDRSITVASTTPDLACAQLSFPGLSACGANPPATLNGQNMCDEALTVPAALTGTGTDLVIAPGAPLSVVIAGSEHWPEGNIAEFTLLLGETEVLVKLDIVDEF